MKATLTTLDDIKGARNALPSVVRRTPILPLAPESCDIGHEKLFLKAECLQVTGAYKVRAAFNVIRCLSEVERKRGIVLASSGNFAQAFAFAGAQLGVSVVVVMLDQTSSNKVLATQELGAEVVFCGRDALNRQPTVEAIAGDRGITSIDTWEYPPVIAGHGSIGLEIIEDAPEVEQILVPVSSGGVAAGIATAVKLSSPHIRIIGVQPEGANAYFLSRKAGKPVTLNHWDTIADGLSARFPGVYPFHHLQEYLDDVVLVSEKDIAASFRSLLYRGKLLVEPAGAVAAAAFFSGKVDQDRTTVAAVTGGNVTAETVQTLLSL
ncbi:MAG: pyridoxal-phosphate dependent enzyme [Pseudomonadota bacterium]|nr:pyridoxal-phosphate dependent enzyme [Pseudomonadota bacterium]MEE3292466.1 pyridoxal-phosphate dependent enzyme [Pseudomonadota bacterium]